MKVKKYAVLFVVLIVSTLLLCACGSEKILWDDVVLGSMLPEPPATKGSIRNNTSEQLWITIDNISDKQYAEYIEACKEKGFTVDAESNSSSYSAYNSQGYRLELSHYGKDADMSIQLEKPMDMTTIKWPSGTAGKQLPAPNSSIGSFVYENDDSFSVYIGDTSRTEYNAYVETCSESGFNVDYSKSENNYFAYNLDGWHLSLSYEGNNTMNINITAPKDTIEETNAPALEDDSLSVTSNEDTDQNPTESHIDNPIGIRPEFQEAMDSYEAFIDEYVAFMKKYMKSDGTDLSLITDYATFVSKYAEFAEDFAKWESEEMSKEETDYYIEVQTRVNKKLLEIA